MTRPSPAPDLETLAKLHGQEYVLRFRSQDESRITQVLEFLHFSEADVVADFGAGLGLLARRLNNRVSRVVGFDFSPEFVEEATRQGEDLRLGNCEFHLADLTSEAIRSQYHGSFDKVFMLDVAEHVPDGPLLEILRTAWLVMKPGGRLVLHTPNLGYILEQLKSRNLLLRQFPEHVAVRRAPAYSDMLRNLGFLIVNVEFLPHYREPMRTIDSAMMHVPIVRRFFQARLLIQAIRPQNQVPDGP